MTSDEIQFEGSILYYVAAREGFLIPLEPPQPQRSACQPTPTPIGVRWHWIRTAISRWTGRALNVVDHRGGTRMYDNHVLSWSKRHECFA